MKGFIEVVTTQDNLRVLVSIKEIETVLEINNGKAFIVTIRANRKEKSSCFGWAVKESYSEVVEKIRQAVE